MRGGGGVLCFKEKTAYEMRISDWSSDVCSSDLLPAKPLRQHPVIVDQPLPGKPVVSGEALVAPIAGQHHLDDLACLLCDEIDPDAEPPGWFLEQIGRPPCRARARQYVYTSCVSPPLKPHHHPPLPLTPPP